jgi:hypothetical protein
MPGLDVEGPVQAEVFVLFRRAGQIGLTGPCGADPWYIEIGDDEDPMVVVAATVRRAIGEPLVVHSTSWRRQRGGVLLTFVTVIDPELVGEMDTTAVARADLARGGTDTAPAAFAYDQIVEHGLRHLAWLVKDDPVVADRLDAGWHAILANYVPEPFRHL